ncbi:hypothetical protein GCM10023215_45860 [Pseudonocardia yuanmonensis]|uniref:Uncharacterized protein n=1 Tax=Pseudonocardia yuanmonensis TaxID=1095914 RepID=A0ABP8X8F0_9PSEU
MRQAGERVRRVPPLVLAEGQVGQEEARGPAPVRGKKREHPALGQQMPGHRSLQVAAAGITRSLSARN